MMKTYRIGMMVILLGLCQPSLAKYSRIPSDELTSGDILSFPQDTVLVENNRAVATVLLPARREFRAAAETAVQQLEAAYGVQFERMDEKQFVKLAVKPRHAIVFGNRLSGPVGLRLDANGLTGGKRYGYDIRTLPQALDYQSNLLVFGGETPENIFSGVQRFLTRFPKENGRVAAPFLIDMANWNDNPSQEEAAQNYVADMRAIYAGEQAQKNTKAIRQIYNCAQEYRATQDPALLHAAVEMIGIMSDNYEGALNYRREPPSFRLHELPKAIDIIDNDPLFDNEALLTAGNLLRRIVVDCMNYWEMQEPMKLYDSGEIKYLVNHPINASQSINVSARYLLSRFDIPEALYWDAVSTHAFKGIAQAQQSPEDSGHYQWSVRRIYNDFCMESGKAEYDTPSLRKYIDFAAAQYNQAGLMASYGDCQPLTAVRGFTMLQLGAELYDDPLCKYVLNSIKNEWVANAVKYLNIPKNIEPPEDRLTGLTCFALDPFLIGYYDLTGVFPPQAPLTNPLNKAVFRSAWKPTGEFLMLNGINYPEQHGHMDGNAIIQYSRGGHYWLVDGDYIKHFPQDHNSLMVARDGVGPDLRRYQGPKIYHIVEQLGSAEAPDHSRAVTVTRMRNYGGLDWTRTIFWRAEKGFLVLDDLTAREPGDYVTRTIWRTLGDVTRTGQTFRVKQMPSENPEIPDSFFITLGDRRPVGHHVQLDYGHGGPFGYYDEYPYAGRNTQVITEYGRDRLAQGERTQYAAFFETGFGENPRPHKLRRLGPSAWLTEGDDPVLVTDGNVESGGTEIDADRALVCKEGITAVHATRLHVAGIDWSSPTPQDVSFAFADANEFRKLHNLLLSQAEPAAPEMPFPGGEPLPETSPAAVLPLPATATALAAHGNRFAVGLRDGTVQLYDQTGTQYASCAVGTEVLALTPVETDKGLCWAVGTRYISREDQRANVLLLDDSGHILWTADIDPYYGFPATVRCLTAAKTGDSLQIIAGCDNRHYYSFDLTGKKRWEKEIQLSATVCTAADTDGDGVDEIFLGTDYYRRMIVDSEGKTLKTCLSDPNDHAVAAGDVLGTGRPVFVIGHESSYVDVMQPDSNRSELHGFYSEINVGGPVSGVAILPNRTGMNIAAATTMNSVVLTDAEGNKRTTVPLPEPLAGLVLANQTLVAAGETGSLYFISPDGKLLSRCKTPEAEVDIYPPRIAALDNGTAVLANGTHLILTK